MKLDHIALQVEEPAKAAEYYKEVYGAEILYCEPDWSFIQFENVKIAFVVKEQHPQHLAFQVDDFEEGDRVKDHRDGTRSTYKRDPFGNIIEFIQYPEE